MIKMKAVKTYLHQKVHTASKEQLMVMLFQAAIQRLESAKNLAGNGKENEAAVFGDKASEIIIELMGTLHHEVAPELCERLQALYTFTVGRITMGNISGKASHYDEALKTLTPVAEAFIESAKTVEPSND